LGAKLAVLNSAILPGVSAPHSAKPVIAIVGAGNVATTLAVALNQAGYSVDQIISSEGVSSLRKARLLARKVEARVAAAGKAQIRADIVWFCVPDSAIAPAAQSLAHSAEWRGRIALHSSGALTSDELAILRGRGAFVASLHPLMTFVPKSRPSLAEVPFAIEGDPAAARAARKIVKNLGGHAFAIREQDKAAYHAWGTFASPLFTALLAATEKVAAIAGVSGKASRKRMLPILQQTLANYAKFGAASAFSGPIVRGDIDTVKRHLQSLRKDPIARQVYASLAQAALAYLPAKNKAAIKKALEALR
jgi:predicted short-subunit dehydrogenase-like oxidoreductase (DUF2520 family)